MAKIDIISGFLGAGKTTLIKKLISDVFAGQKVVLIENEFGEIGIDGGFLKEAGINITEMNSGCICCSLVGDFAEALKKVVEQFHPDHIIIEPSGVGKLSDIRDAVEHVGEECDLEIGSLVTVADVKKVKMYMKNFGEFYNNQIESAGTIILSRTQNASKEKIDEAIAMIREKNPEATIITTPWDELSGQTIHDAMVQSVSLADLLLAEEEEHHHHHHHHGGHDADEIFQSWGAESPKTYTDDEIRSILKTLADSTEDDYGFILRSKGMVPREDGTWIHFDMVPEETEIRTGAADYTGRIVVIGAGLKEDRIQELFGL